ncbi:alpha/beta hydrolase [Sphingomonas lycopersici]|uniref:Alpha/beta hydrolase n=1 Tax=Sphingomonas lycopersici TaxID=2951807 RepID=A0AA41ZAI5_9SPHN|nr:alpha/beta hydrolase [Sphingomonas lycopersici]MCW6536470.1 alpha/beta hydrolase [Sphingomonas lycopersici]
MLDPHIEGLMRAMAESGFRLPNPFEARAMRMMLDSPLPAPPVEIAEVRDITIPGPAGAMRARLYRPGEGRLPLVILFHGGGWVHGTLDSHDRLARGIARDADCAVLSVDYRLAPEHRFPAAIDDAVAAARWARGNAAALGVDPAHYAITGDSAGGNLAAAVAQILAGAADAPAHQLLFYPVLDGRCASASFAVETPGFLSPSQMRWYWDQYAPGDARLDHRASPALAPVAASLAPATIVVTGNDPLHDEGVAYAEALKAAGVPVTLHDAAGGIHGFVSLFGMIPIADEALAIGTAALRTALHG